MKKRHYVYIIIFIFFVLFASDRIFKPFAVFTYHETVGSSKYYKAVTSSVKVYDWNKEVKKLSYCFKNAKYCRLLDKDDSRYYSFNIEYPSSSKWERLCFYVNDKESCNKKAYLVDGSKLKVRAKNLFATVSANKDIDYKRYFDISDNISGLNKVNCKKILGDEIITLKCKFLANNGSEKTAQTNLIIKKTDILYAKKIAFLGDSITKADLDAKSFDGWAGRVAMANNMKYKNLGVNGATLAKVEGRSHIEDQLDKIDKDSDYIIIQGGINDASLGRGSQFEGPYNQTMIGGLERIFIKAKEKFPKSKIAFIITYNTPKITSLKRDRDVEAIRELCQMYRIPYLDLYDGSYDDGINHQSFAELLDVNGGSSFYQNKATDVHLSEVGYDKISPFIIEWIRSL